MESISTLRLYKRSVLSKTKPISADETSGTLRNSYQQYGNGEKLPNLQQNSIKRFGRFTNGLRNGSTNNYTGSRMNNITAMSFSAARFNENVTGYGNTEMSPAGQAILAKYYRNMRSSNNSTANKSLINVSNLPHHTLVNYVPFYEVRGRGDGASVVEEPQTEHNKTNEDRSKQNVDDENIPNKDLTIEQRFLNVRPYTSAEVHQHNWTKQTERSRLKSDGDEVGQSQPEKTKPRSAIRRLNFDSATNKLAKHVRFSNSVFMNKVEEPDYVETLLNSMRKRPPPPVNHSSPKEEDSHVKFKSPPPEVTENRTAEPEGMSSIGEAEEEAFVSPITRITVTKRKHVGQAEASKEFMETKFAESLEQNDDRIANITTKLLKYSKNLPSSTQTITPENGRRSAGSFPISKMSDSTQITRFVQKKQTLINPSFPPQTPANRRSFLSYSEKLSRSNAARNVKSASYNKKTVNDAGIKTDLSARSLKPKVQYISLDIEAPRQQVNFNVANVESVKTFDKVDTTPPITTVYASDFQPIPSMPEHINFCDPRKTEHIMLWLDDVNTKRNMATKIRRTYMTRSAR